MSWRVQQYRYAMVLGRRSDTSTQRLLLLFVGDACLLVCLFRLEEDDE